MPVMSAFYCNFANPIISDAVNVPHVSVEINKRFYYYLLLVEKAEQQEKWEKNNICIVM